jgi:hypothetical protein
MPNRPISRHGARIHRRKASYKLSYRYRWLRLTSHEQVELRTLRNMFMYGLVLKYSGVDAIRLRDLLALISLRYMSILFIFDPVVRLGSLPLRTSINEFNDSDCHIFFRFLKADLHNLRQLLRFPDKIVFENGSTMSGEEVFLRGLYELALESRSFCLALEYSSTEPSAFLRLP